ncbi:MAG: NAD(P)H-binding protein [Acidimicrobiia bacterium]|nr:NAD(P)H-binding protein [Acidimicrobiia bacterium]
MENEVHVVFGTGPVGLATVDLLAAQGHHVRAVNRSGRAEVPAGVEVRGGDATDSAFSVDAAKGAAVVYQCLNPPYTKWPELFPALQAGVLDGAAAAGAKLVAMDNLYMYGPTMGAAITEDVPYAAIGKKGRTRAKMAQDLLEAHRMGKARVAIGRASDYFGPRGLLSAMGERVFYPALAGKKAQVMGDPNQPHTYSYIPDIAKGLVILGERAEADGEAWHLPNAPALTTSQLIEQVYAAAGTEPGLSAMPRFMVSLIGLFNGTVRELKEMLYEFEDPYVVDSAKFQKAFGDHATPLSESIPATVEWFRSNPKS